MTSEILQKPLGEVTINELLQIFFIGKTSNNIEASTEPVIETLDRFDYGIAGLARTLGCGKTRAQTIKNSGYLDQAIIQAGRSIKINKEKAMELYQRYQHKI